MTVRWKSNRDNLLVASYEKTAMDLGNFQTENNYCDKFLEVRFDSETDV